MIPGTTLRPYSMIPGSTLRPYSIMGCAEFHPARPEHNGRVPAGPSLPRAQEKILHLLAALAVQISAGSPGADRAAHYLSFLSALGVSVAVASVAAAVFAATLAPSTWRVAGPGESRRINRVAWCASSKQR